MEMLLTGELISSDKAAKIGLINDVIEINKLKDFTLDKAQKISKKSSVTLKIGKEAFYKQLDMKLSDAYDYASKVMVQNMLKLDAKEGIDAVSTVCIETDNWNIGPKCGGPFSVTDGEADIRVCEDERDDLSGELVVDGHGDHSCAQDTHVTYYSPHDTSPVAVCL